MSRTNTIGTEILTLKRFRLCDEIPLHLVTSNKFNPILMMQWIASIWAPVIYIFELAQTEQDISDPCV